MARKDIENSILKSLQQDWDVANDPEDDINKLNSLAYGDEGAREILDNEFDADERDAFNAKPFSEQLKLRKEARRVMDGEDRNAEQRARRNAEFEKLDNRQRFGYGLNQAFGEGKHDHQKAYWNARSSQDLDIEAPKIQQIFGTNATTTRARDLIRESQFLPGFVRDTLGSNAADYESRKGAGLGLMSDGSARAGQIVGTALSDINQDRLRNFWWLMNAPQAVTNVAQEYGLSKSAPDLYSSDKITDNKGFEMTLDKENYA